MSIIKVSKGWRKP